MRSLTLIDVLRRHLPSPASTDAALEAEPGLAHDLEATLRELISSARGEFPMIALRDDVFIAYLAERLPPDLPLALALRQVHAMDLYLACACGRGDRGAVVAFEARCLSTIDRVLAKLGIDADARAEVTQEIRGRVIAGTGGERAEIFDFSGRGDLRGWVRVMAVRRALQHQRHARRELPLPLDEDERLQQLVAPGHLVADPRKGMYQQEFKRAFEAALQALPDRERTLLRQHYIDALTVDEIGALYRVHRSTAARLLVRARQLVLEATRVRMMSDLGVEPPDLDSIMRMIRSQLDVSLRVLLRRPHRRLPSALHAQGRAAE